MSQPAININIDRELNRRNPYEVEEMPVCRCALCGGYIYRGDTAYDIGEETWCEKCVDDAKYYVED